MLPHPECHSRTGHKRRTSHQLILLVKAMSPSRPANSMLRGFTLQRADQRLNAAQSGRIGRDRFTDVFGAV